MCLPALAIAGIAGSLLGAGASFLGQRKAEHATTRAFNRERARQQAFDAEQQGRFEDSLDAARSLTDPNDVAKAVANRQAAFDSAAKSAAPAAEGYLPGSASANQIVASASDAAGAKADANTATLGHALASLGGFGDQLQGANTKIARNGQLIDQLQSFKLGSLDVAEAEKAAAARKGSGLRTLGGVISGLGNLALAGGLGGAAGLSGPTPIGVLSQGPVAAPFNPSSLLTGI